MVETKNIYYLIVWIGSLRVAQIALRVSHGVEVKISPEATVIWRFDGDQIISFEDGLLTWLLAGGLSSLPCGKGHKRPHIL